MIDMRVPDVFHRQMLQAVKRLFRSNFAAGHGLEQIFETFRMHSVSLKVIVFPVQ